MEINPDNNIIIFGEKSSGKSDFLERICDEKCVSPEVNINISSEFNINTSSISTKKIAKIDGVPFQLIEIEHINKSDDAKQMLKDLKKIFTLAFKYIFITFDVSKDYDFKLYDLFFKNFSIINNHNLYIVLTNGDSIPDDEQRQDEYLKIQDGLKMKAKKNNYQLNLKNSYYYDKKNIEDVVRNIHLHIKDINTDNSYIKIKGKLNSLEEMFKYIDNKEDEEEEDDEEGEKTDRVKEKETNTTEKDTPVNEEENECDDSSKKTSGGFINNFIDFINKFDFFKNPETII